MNQLDLFELYELLALRFLVALEHGDLDVLADLWSQAEASPDLEAMFCELSELFCSDVTGQTPEPDIKFEVRPTDKFDRLRPSSPRIEIETALERDSPTRPDKSTPMQRQLYE
jgi:hypothetical protein